MDIFCKRGIPFRNPSSKYKWCDGELKPTGICYYTYPAQYEYKCEKCGEIKLIEDPSGIPVIDYRNK